MLKLTSSSNKKDHFPGDVVYTLVANKIYTVGRKNADFAFEDDQSVSRRHAEIKVEHPLANVSNPSLPPSFILKDVGSKFGTYIDDGIEGRNKASLLENNVLQLTSCFRIGLQWNEFKISYTPLIITTSTLSFQETQDLKETICELGGHIVNDWRPSCDFVVMESLTLTIKVVCALLCGKYIVKPSYFHDYLKAVHEQFCEKDPVLPPPSAYLPPIKETQISGTEALFSPTNKRGSLFSGKLFLFDSSKSLKKFGVAVVAGGGSTSTLLSSATPSVLKDENTVVVGSAGVYANASQDIKNAIQIYYSAKKRTVQESELGLAALYSDTSKYTNPFSVPLGPSGLRISTQTQLNSSASVLIAPDSQEPPKNPHIKLTQGANQTSVISESFQEPSQAVEPSQIPPTPTPQDEKNSQDDSKEQKIEGKEESSKDTKSVEEPSKDSETRKRALSGTEINENTEVNSSKRRLGGKNTKTLASLFNMSSDDDFSDDDDNAALLAAANQIEDSISVSQFSNPVFTSTQISEGKSSKFEEPLPKATDGAQSLVKLATNVEKPSTSKSAQDLATRNSSGSKSQYNASVSKNPSFSVDEIPESEGEESENESESIFKSGNKVNEEREIASGISSKKRKELELPSSHVEQQKKSISNASPRGSKVNTNSVVNTHTSSGLAQRGEEMILEDALDEIKTLRLPCIFKDLIITNKKESPKNVLTLNRAANKNSNAVNYKRFVPNNRRESNRPAGPSTTRNQVPIKLCPHQNMISEDVEKQNLNGTAPPVAKPRNAQNTEPRENEEESHNFEFEEIIVERSQVRLDEMSERINENNETSQAKRGRKRVHQAPDDPNPDPETSSPTRVTRGRARMSPVKGGAQVSPTQTSPIRKNVEKTVESPSRSTRSRKRAPSPISTSPEPQVKKQATRRSARARNIPEDDIDDEWSFKL